MKPAYPKMMLLGLLLTLVLTSGCSPQIKPDVTVVDNKLADGDPSDKKPEIDTLESSSDQSDQDSSSGLVADPNLSENSPVAIGKEKKKDAAVEPTIDIPSTWKRLSEKQEIWFDTDNKQVIVGGKVCLDAGPLEMLICPLRTKEHESIVAVNAESWQVHAALKAVGANEGVPARWVPEYTPAWGAKISVEMIWRDEETKQIKKIDGKQWILNADTQKPMTTELVFGGSYHEPQSEGGKQRYVADDGELICLANFSTSTIDIQVDEKNIDIYFEANSPLIPPINTQVYTVITPGAVIGKPEE